MKQMTFLDLCSGIGGFRLGLETAGHKCIGYCEYDKFARASYEAMYDTEGEWKAHTGLRKLQKQCTEKEESRKILQILAVNSEYQENYENAGFYYEQMLLYDETYRAGYGEYGMFLFRTGQKEAGQALWTEYKSKETMLDDTVSRNLRLWEKEMTKSEEKS